MPHAYERQESLHKWLCCVYFGVEIIIHKHVRKLCAVSFNIEVTLHYNLSKDSHSSRCLPACSPYTCDRLAKTVPLAEYLLDVFYGCPAASGKSVKRSAMCKSVSSVRMLAVVLARCMPSVRYGL